MASKNSESVVQFFKHVVKTFCAIRENNCRIGHKIIVKEYLKICFKYVFFEMALGRKIFEETFLNKSVKVLGYRLFITLFETIFIYDEYFFQSDNPEPIVIDCGANIGMSTLYFKTLYPQAKIIAIEPDSQTYKVLSENINSNELTDVEVVNKAVSGKNGGVDFYIDKVNPGSLVMSTIQSRVPNKTKITVMSIKLSELINKYTKVHLLKIDIEGAELEVLREITRSGAINKVDQLIVEYHHHILPSENQISELFSLLERANFRYLISTHKQFNPFIRDTYQDILVFAYRNPELTK